MNLDIEFIRYRDGTILPERKSDGAAGYDLAACIDNEVVIYAYNKAVLIPTGLKLWIRDRGVVGVIAPRSSSSKNGLMLGNSCGFCDSDFQGEIMLSVCLRPDYGPLKIENGDRLAQMFFMPVYHPTFKEVQQFSDLTERAEGAFGSTGRGN